MKRDRLGIERIEEHPRCILIQEGISALVPSWSLIRRVGSGPAKGKGKLFMEESHGTTHGVRSLRVDG